MSGVFLRTSIRESRYSRPFLRRKNATGGTDGEREQMPVEKSKRTLTVPFPTDDRKLDRFPRSDRTVAAISMRSHSLSFSTPCERIGPPTCCCFPCPILASSMSFSPPLQLCPFGFAKVLWRAVCFFFCAADHMREASKIPQKTAPPDSLLAAERSPPCAWKICWAIVSPRPDPPVCRLREVSPRCSGLKTCGRS